MAEPRSQPLDTPMALVLLSMAAGGADAAGYLGLAKTFTANMTGNIVLLGIALSEGRSADTGRSLASLFAFIVGACVGGWLCRRVAPKDAGAPQITGVLACEAVLLLIFAVAWASVAPEQRTALTYPLISLLGISMGLQSAAVVRIGIAGVVTTVVTGTLTSLLTGVMKALTSVPLQQGEKPADLHTFGLQAVVIIVYGASAAVSGLLMRYFAAAAGFFPVAVLAVVLVTRWARRS